MRKAYFFQIIPAIVFLMGLAGCQGVHGNSVDRALERIRIQRTVDNNLFSSSFPEIKLRIAPEFTYLGEASFVQSTSKRTRSQELNENALDVRSYIFVANGENNVMGKGVLIRATVMRGDPSQTVKGDYFAMGNVLNEGEMKILDEEYQYTFLTQQDLFTDEEKALLNRNIPSCFLVKRLDGKAGLGNKSNLQILYFEDLSPYKGIACQEAMHAQNMTGEQKSALKEFDDRSYQSMRFIKTTLDTTSRYVDSDAKDAEAVKAPAPQDTGASKVQTIENRLKTLKDLHDKNLITDEEFNKKKAEILKDL
jgi:hypothetical protein